MIEFYSKYFPKNYKAKVKQLIIDIERLLIIEEITILNAQDIILDESFKNTLDNQTWQKLNDLYYTLYHHQDTISPTLNKFINKIKQPKTEQSIDGNFSFIDTFAGCGGLSLGMIQSGFKPELVNEIEPKFLETYYFNHDIHLDNYYCCDIDRICSDEIIKNNFHNIDLVVGGPPCQGFSMANRQRIIDDPRNKLYKSFLQLLANVRPKFFVMENVKGMMKKSSEILDNFHDMLGDEYSFDLVLLNAKNFGIPQNRERVFVIGTKLKQVSIQTIIDDILTESSEEKICLEDALFGLPKLQPKTQKNTKGIENNAIGFKFRKYDYQTNSFLNTINMNNSVYLSNHTNRYNNDRDIEIFATLPQGANSLHESIKDIMPYTSRNHMFKDKYFKLSNTEVSKTITSHMKFDCNMYIHPTQPRGLSPREAARIQTFPDDFVFMGANNIWYAQIGNAVPVRLASIIGKQIIKQLSKHNEQ